MYIITIPQEPSVVIDIPQEPSITFGIGLTNLITGECMGLYDVTIKDKLSREEITRMLTLLQQDLLLPLQERHQLHLYQVYHALSELFAESARVNIDLNLVNNSIDVIMEELPHELGLNIGAWMIEEQRFGFVDFHGENRNILLDIMFENAGIL